MSSSTAGGGPSTNTAITALPPIADPAPLGLAAFALTTFLFSAANAKWTHGTSAWLGYAFAYGGLVQLLAGMWEFRNRNVFGATAFSSYGGFWIGAGLYVELVAPTAKSAFEVGNDLAWISLAFLIFNTYMLLWSATLNLAVFGVFLTLEVTELILAIGNFDHTGANIVKVGGYIGIVTAAVAWYTSAAGVINGMSAQSGGRPILYVGAPLIKLGPRS